MATFNSFNDEYSSEMQGIKIESSVKFIFELITLFYLWDFLPVADKHSDLGPVPTE